MKILFDSSRQCKQLQLEKPSGIEYYMPIHKRLAINLLLRSGKKDPPPPLIELNVCVLELKFRKHFVTEYFGLSSFETFAHVF